MIAKLSPMQHEMKIKRIKKSQYLREYWYSGLARDWVELLICSNRDDNTREVCVHGDTMPKVALSQH